MARETKVLDVEGMSCNHCANSIKNAVGGLNGVAQVSVDLECSNVAVEFEPDLIDLDTIKNTIEEQGYDVK